MHTSSFRYVPYHLKTGRTLFWYHDPYYKPQGQQRLSGFKLLISYQHHQIIWHAFSHWDHGYTSVENFIQAIPLPPLNQRNSNNKEKGGTLQTSQ